MKIFKTVVALTLLAACIPSYGDNAEVVDRYSIDEAQLLFAKRTNGEAWKLLEKETLSHEEEDLLIYTVFSSAYHWHYAGTSVNKQRAEWLISRAYTKIQNADAALSHATKCLELTTRQNSELKDFDYAYAYEAMARAYALHRDFDNASIYYGKAKQASEAIAGAEDKALFLSDLASGDWNGFVLENESDD